jgi:hypothetical protein
MRRQVNFLMGRDDMRRLVLILMSIFLTSMAAHAITVINGTDGTGQTSFEFGNIPIGETREIAILLPITYTATPIQIDLANCITSVVIVKCEKIGTDSWMLDPSPLDPVDAFKVISADCGPKPGECIAFQVTSRIEDMLNGGQYLLYYQYSYDFYGYDVNGKSYIFAGNSGSFYGGGVSYHPIPSPVPVPTALPLLASGLAGLGVMRKRRKKV